jgi:hypothetical protein
MHALNNRPRWIGPMGVLALALPLAITTTPASGTEEPSGADFAIGPDGAAVL